MCISTKTQLERFEKNCTTTLERECSLVNKINETINKGDSIDGPSLEDFVKIFSKVEKSHFVAYSMKSTINLLLMRVLVAKMRRRLLHFTFSASSDDNGTNNNALPTTLQCDGLFKKLIDDALNRSNRLGTTFDSFNDIITFVDQTRAGVQESSNLRT